MKLTMEFQLPEEMHEADRAYHSQVAWTAIAEALDRIRLHTKYGDGTAMDALEHVREILYESRRRLE